MKQTVVEWLIDQLEQKGEASVNMSIGRMQISIIEEDYINLLEQAKEMENKHLKQAFKDSRKANIFEENKPPLYKDFEEWFKQLKDK